MQLGIWGSAVISPSAVWGESPATLRFDTFQGLRKRLFVRFLQKCFLIKFSGLLNESITVQQNFKKIPGQNVPCPGH